MSNMDSFEPIGMTPPKGRQGHSVPLPKQLEGGLNLPKLDSWTTTDLQNSGSSSSGSAVSPAQFYAHRDHSLGGSLSKLDRMRSHPESLMMETFDEAEEYDEPDSKDLTDGDANPPLHHHSKEVSSPDSGVRRQSSTGIRGRRASMSLDKFTGDSLLFFSYSPATSGSGLNPDLQLGGSFVRAFTQGLSSSLNYPYFQGNSPPGVLTSPGLGSSGEAAQLFPTAARNPNKAIVTIDALSSRILMANEMTCELFGYQRDDLSGMKVQKLFTEPYSGEQRALMEQNISASGETVLISGKVMDAVTCCGIEFPVSVWMRKVGTPEDTTTHGREPPPTPRVILVIEPVERSSALFSMNANHVIASCDPWFACLFGFQDSTEVIGRHINDLIPSLKLLSITEDLTKMPSKQAVTGRAKDGTVFPLTVKFTEISQSLSIGDLYSPTHTSHQMSCTSPDKSTTAKATQHSSENSSELPPPSSDHTPSDSSPSAASTTESYINAKVIVYAALSGMISFFLDGTIHGCNHHFALMLFGYTQQELQKKDITFLLPEFYQHIGYVDDRSMPLPPLDEEDFLFHSVAERSLSPDKASDFLKAFQDTQMLRKSPRQHQSPRKQALPFNKERVLPQELQDFSMGTGEGDLATTAPLNRTTDQMHSSSYMSCDNAIPTVSCINSSQEDLPPVPKRLVPSLSTERIMAILNQHDASSGEDKDPPLSSTPSKSRPTSSHNAAVAFQLGSSQEVDQASLSSVPEGTFMGSARHKDGSLMAVVFQLKQISLNDGRDICCMWLSRDLDLERARTADLSMSMSRPPPDPYRNSMIISPEVDIGEDKDGGASHTHVPHLQHQQSQQFAEELVAMEGEYSVNYKTLNNIGKGAFGFVRLAQRIADETLVVVKFLRRSSVLKDCWVNDSEMGGVPLEIALLARLSHPNIVQLLEAYENEHFFQMVMEKHGEGLDLFEFIERGPRLTEQHVSYIFRQLVAALAYLHGKNIVHRDIKDENIIINQHFHIKLIDFGSAAYMATGKLFHTFCGTLEYCSPEVLLGNSYSGPELEMWALGVTLYTLVFGENPFFDVEETIAGHLQPPFLTSPALMKLLFWLLHPDPRSRATIKDLQKDKWTNQTLDTAQLTFDTVFGQVTTTGGGEEGQSSSGPAHKATGAKAEVVAAVKSSSVGDIGRLSRSVKGLVVNDGAEEGGDWC